MRELIEKISALDGVDMDELDMNELDSYGSKSGYLITTNKQQIKLLIDDQQNCCEDFGYFWCNETTDEFIGSELLDIRITDKALNQVEFTRLSDIVEDASFEGGVMFVDLLTSEGVLQFVAYNNHNGYYGHDAVVQSTQLNHMDRL